MSNTLIRLIKRHRVNEAKTWGVFTAREQVRHGVMGGWASVVFIGKVPTSLSKVYRVTLGEWFDDPKYGQQLKVFGFETVALENPRITITGTICELAQTNDAGTWFLYDGGHNDRTARFVSFEPLTEGDYQLNGEWEANSYGQYFKVVQAEPIGNHASDWQHSQPIAEDFSDAIP